MERNSALTLLILAAFTAAPCLAEPARSPLTSLLPSTETGLDALTRQIQRKLNTQPDGGVTTFVGLPTGQSIKLESVELAPQPLTGPIDANTLRPGDPAAGLKTGAGLLPKEDKPAKSRRPAKKASEQLKVIEKQGVRQDWGEGAKQAKEPAPARRSDRESLL